MGEFDTQLTPAEEKAYQEWMKKIGHTPEKGMAVDKNLTGANYDYRGWFKKNGPKMVGKGVHFNDEFKKPNHPRFSNESVYATNPMIGGMWNGENLTPTSTKAVANRMTGSPVMQAYSPTIRDSSLNSLAEFIKQRIPWVNK